MATQSADPRLEALREEVIASLKVVHDPEIPVNIVDLGLVYEVDVKENGHVDITMTLTTMGCPVQDMIQTDAELAAMKVDGIESAAVEDAVAMQKAAGLRVCTDGEFHRRHWFLDFLEKIDGIEVHGGLPVKFHNEQGEVEFAPPRFEVRGKIGRSRNLSLEDFEALKPVADRHGLVAKQSIPSPMCVHFRGGRAAVDKSVYPAIEEFFADLANWLHRQEGT